MHGPIHKQHRMKVNPGLLSSWHMITFTHDSPLPLFLLYRMVCDLLVRVDQCVPLHTTHTSLLTLECSVHSLLNIVYNVTHSCTTHTSLSLMSCVKLTVTLHQTSVQCRPVDHQCTPLRHPSPELSSTARVVKIVLQ